MKTEKEIINETENLKRLASTCEDSEMRHILAIKIETLLWVHNNHYDN